MGSAGVPRQAGAGGRRTGRLRRGPARAARRRPERPLRGPRGRRRPLHAGRLRVGTGDSLPRLRCHRREPEAVHRLFRHHCPSRRGPPAHGSRHVLRPRCRGRGRQGGDRVHPGALPRGAARGRCRRGSARPGRPLRARHRWRQGLGAACWRLPLAPHANHGNALGDRPRRGHLLLRGRGCAALVHRWGSGPARPCRQTRPGPRSRSRRDGEVRVARG